MILIQVYLENYSNSHNSQLDNIKSNIHLLILRVINVSRIVNVRIIGVTLGIVKSSTQVR